MEPKYAKISNIKSPFILKKIFSILYITKKLDLIIYNKKIQNQLFIGLDDYKKIASRYKIVEKNGLGKEYLKDTNLVIFEGNYKNGKRNGHGLEYYENKVIKYDGYYLNGKKIYGKIFDKEGNNYFYLEYGEGKEYYFNGSLIFKGKYYDGKRWNGYIYNNKENIECEIKYGKGIIKEYNKNGKLIFKGEYFNGLRNGKGKEYIGDKDIIQVIDNYYERRFGEDNSINEDKYLLFKGNYINGLRHGKGEEYYINGNILFEGEYLYGKRWNGTIYNYKHSEKYEIKNGKGEIKEYYCI